MKAYEISLQTAFDEHLSICVKLENDEKLALTCIYRSPSSTTDNNNALCKIIKEIDSRSELLKVILSDFNYPSITWNNLHYEITGNNESKDPDNFKESIIESYLNQLVDFPTRARGTDNPSCIDWVFTNNEALINGVTEGSPLGSSDHTMIEVDINTTPKDNSTHYKKYYYDKGNYTDMREFVAEKMTEIPDTKDIQDLWTWLRNILTEARDTYIPSKNITGKRKKQHTDHYDEKIIRKIRKKHKCWQRYMETRSGEKYIEYRRLSNQVKNLTKKAKKNMERDIAK